jgi:hypothetical protein
MIKLLNILKEIKIQKPGTGLMLFKTHHPHPNIKDGIGLLVDNKYMYHTNNFVYHNTQYIPIYCGIDMDNNELEISLIEPGFGGGVNQDEADEAYNLFDEEVRISQEILPKYCSYYDDENYTIPLSKIQNGKTLS